MYSVPDGPEGTVNDDVQAWASHAEPFMPRTEPRPQVAKRTDAFHEKVPAGGWWLWCSSGGKFTVGWTKELLLVENSMTHQGVTLLHTD
jgi:hypothetical protein